MMSHNIFSNHAQFFLIDDSEFLLANRISIEAQIRTIEVALWMTMGEKVKLHELRRFIFYRIFRFIYQIQWWGQFECKWGRMGRLFFFPLKFNSPKSFYEFFLILWAILYIIIIQGKDCIMYEFLFIYFYFYFIMVEGYVSILIYIFESSSS